MYSQQENPPAISEQIRDYCINLNQSQSYPQFQFGGFFIYAIHKDVAPSATLQQYENKTNYRT